MSRRKSGFPVKLTGPVLVALRMAGAHHVYENEHDEEIRRWLDQLPRPEWENSVHRYPPTPTCTIRVSPSQVESFIRLLKIAAANPHNGPGIGTAIQNRIEKLEGLGPIERLGAIGT